MDITLIIVNWNTAQVTCDCLRSVYNQTQGVAFEVILVDNGSSDDSVARIENEFPRVKLIVNQGNRGFAAANNQGLAIANGRYLLLLNSDTIILDNALMKAVAFADQHPEAGVIGCRILNPDESLQRSCFLFPSILNLMISTCYLDKLFPKSKLWGRERMTWWNHDDVRAVDVVMGAFVLVRREALEGVGWLDDDYFMYGEETDWCQRFQQAGWQVLFTPDGQIIHLGGQSSKQVKPRMILQLRAGIMQYVKKNRSCIYYRMICFVFSFWFGLRVFPWFIKYMTSGCRNNTYNILKAYCVGTIKSMFGWKSLSFRN